MVSECAKKFTKIIFFFIFIVESTQAVLTSRGFVLLNNFDSTHTESESANEDDHNSVSERIAWLHRPTPNKNQKIIIQF